MLIVLVGMVVDAIIVAIDDFFVDVGSLRTQKIRYMTEYNQTLNRKDSLEFLRRLLKNSKMTIDQMIKVQEEGFKRKAWKRIKNDFPELSKR